MKPSIIRIRAGFTLIELLVSISIIMILAGMIFVISFRSRAKARSVACMSNMRHLAMARINETEVDLLAGTGADIRKCTEGGGYAYNPYAYDLTKVADPARTVLVYESKGSGSGAEEDVDRRHLGGSNFAFADGHVKWLKEIPPFKP